MDTGWRYRMKRSSTRRKGTSAFCSFSCSFSFPSLSSFNISTFHSGPSASRTVTIGVVLVLACGDVASDRWLSSRPLRQSVHPVFMFLSRHQLLHHPPGRSSSVGQAGFYVGVLATKLFTTLFITMNVLGVVPGDVFNCFYSFYYHPSFYAHK